MFEALIPNPQALLLVFVTYTITAASPGPSNMAIMAIAMSEGRTRALAFAAGVVSGSFFWCFLAMTGVSAALTAYADLLIAIKILGGGYLLFLAFKAARSASSPVDPGAVGMAGLAVSFGALYRRGLLFHLTNPKSIMGWLAIAAIGVDRSATLVSNAILIAGCLALAIVIFGGYALLFSTPVMVSSYRRMRRAIQGTLALVFGYAGLRLLTSRS